MSAIGGIYNLDSAPFDEGMLALLDKGLAVRGPDGGLEYRDGQIGMLYRAFHTTEESLSERQPLVSSEGLVLCWDGRLDNRGDLIRELRDQLHGDRTDAALVMAAYRVRGLDFLSWLLGDFALSLWDARKRILVLARDAIGPRPLYYHHSTEKIIWSSEIGPLLSLVRVAIEIDDEYVVSYLIAEPDPDRTPFKQVDAVPPGKAVIFSQQDSYVRTFWDPALTREIVYKRDSEYEDHFRELFRNAVRCRLRSGGLVWAELSGGLDSSSIVCMTDQLLKSGEAQASDLNTVSYVFEESATSDERRFIRHVEEKMGRLSTHLPERKQRILLPHQDQPFAGIPSYLLCYAERHRLLCELIRESGARVLLSGHGGDHLLWSAVDASPELADLLVQREPLRLHRRILEWSRAQKRPYLNLLWKGAILPILPRHLRRVFRLVPQVPDILDRRLVADLDLPQRLLGRNDGVRSTTPSRREQNKLFYSAVSIISAISSQERGLLEFRYPFLDRSLVEFLLSIPFEQLLRPGETRSLQRRALRGLLPEKTLRRKSKRGLDEALFRALIREWTELGPMFADARVCARGYVNSRRLLAALDRARHGQEINTYILLKTISLEFWLRSLEQRGAMPKSAAVARDATKTVHSGKGEMRP
jgi:asparagine synthase (glutamine-hydrolysing)